MEVTVSSPAISIADLFAPTPRWATDPRLIQRSIPRNAGLVKDVDVRRFLRMALPLRDVSSDLYVLEELAVSASARADLVTVSDSIHCYEIKSERDTLERLPVQGHAYSQVFDFVTLVVAERLRTSADRMVPKWWGIEVIGTSGGSVRTMLERTPQANPEICSRRLVELLSKDDAIALLQVHGYVRGIGGRPKQFLYELIAQELPTTTIHAAVVAKLRLRSKALRRHSSD